MPLVRGRLFYISQESSLEFISFTYCEKDAEELSLLKIYLTFGQEQIYNGKYTHLQSGIIYIFNKILTDFRKFFLFVLCLTHQLTFD